MVKSIKSVLMTKTSQLSCVSGVCWKSLPGGGFLVSKSWDFSDTNMLYLYPDCRTGLIGSFHNSDLVAAKQTDLDNFVTVVNNREGFNDNEKE